MYMFLSSKDEHGEYFFKVFHKIGLTKDIEVWDSSIIYFYIPIFICINIIYLRSLYNPWSTRQFFALLVVFPLIFMTKEASEIILRDNESGVKDHFNSSIESLTFLVEQMAPTENRSCFLTTSPDMLMQSVCQRGLLHWVEKPVNTTVVDEKFEKECSENPYNPVCAYKKQFSYYNHSRTVLKLVAALKEEALAKIPFWLEGTGQVWPDSDPDGIACLEGIEQMLCDQYLPQCGRTCYRRSICREDCLAIQNICPPNLFTSMISSMQIGSFYNLWTYALPEEYKDSFFEIINMMADRTCTSEKLSDNRLVPTRAWEEQGGTLDSCLDSETEPSYLVYPSSYLFMGKQNNGMNSKEYVDMIEHNSNPSSATLDRIWPNTTISMDDYDKGVSYTPYNVSWPVRFPIILDSSAWWRSGAEILFAMSPRNINFIFSAFRFRFSTVEEHFDFLVLRLFELKNSKGIYMKVTNYYLVNLRLITTILAGLIPYFISNRKGLLEANVDESKALLDMNVHLAINTHFIHLLVFCQCITTSYMIYTSAVLSEWVGLVDKYDNDMSAWVINIMWIMSFILYNQICSAIILRPAYLAKVWNMPKSSPEAGEALVENDTEEEIKEEEIAVSYSKYENIWWVSIKIATYYARIKDKLTTMLRMTNNMFILPLYNFIRIDKLSLVRAILAWLLDIFHSLLLYWTLASDTLLYRGIRHNNAWVILSKITILGLVYVLTFWTNIFDKTRDKNRKKRDTIRFTLYTTLVDTVYMVLLAHYVEPFHGRDLIFSSGPNGEGYDRRVVALLLSTLTFFAMIVRFGLLVDSFILAIQKTKGRSYKEILQRPEEIVDDRLGCWPLSMNRSAKVVAVTSEEERITPPIN
ncbi:hypothetical protein TrLO_g15159 [Triparma laevis f. longispina]|uniref:FZ domain-containing protein n=1 Tax=Triparma laevis f. longispina TaxID=1714387 RepID=A0A9W7A4W5_9STRA|nr:hypothetical protein TrLO_g15159 [Triparma laevis f. longispina]